MKSLNLIKSALVVALATMTIPMVSHAQLLVYGGDFTGRNNTPLDTVAATTGPGTVSAGGSLSSTWTTSGTVKLDGTGGVKMSGANNGNLKTAILPLNIQSNLIYTITAQVDPLNAGQVYIGFLQDGDFTNFADGAVLEIRGNSKPELNGVKFGNNTSDTGPHDIILTLNTTGSVWELTGEIVGGSSASFSYTLGNPTGINTVGFAGGNGNSALTSFTVTAVPEPSSYALGLIMLGVLAFEIRRRRALAA